MSLPSESVPVLIIAYKRYDTTRKVVDAVRAAGTREVYFAANAPNPNSPNDERQCSQVRSLIDDFRPSVKVHTLFRTQHLSAKESIVSAIDWFFDNVHEGIILEDDCVPALSFFPFCGEMLAKYRNEPTVMHIGASNFQPSQNWDSRSYYFSRYSYIWGWATWRRAWKTFDVTLEELSQHDFGRTVDARFRSDAERSYWCLLYRYLMGGQIDTWDYQWNFSVWAKGGYSIVPGVNMVSNIGFGNHATNTTSADSKFANLPVREIEFPLQYAESLEYCDPADANDSDNLFGISRSYRSFHLKIRVAKLLSRSVRTKLKKLLRW